MKKNWLVLLGLTGICMTLIACGSQNNADNVQSNNEERISVQEVSDESDDKGKENSKDTVLKDTKSAVQITPVEFFHVSYLDDGTIALSNYSGDEEQVVIPDMVEGKKVTIIQEDTFANHDEIVYVSIPDSVVEIEKNAFVNCSNVESIEFGEGIKKIGDYAFGVNLK